MAADFVGCTSQTIAFALTLSGYLPAQVTMDDFTKAKEKALYRKKGNIPEGLYL